jgi:hypothetical protein
LEPKSIFAIVPGVALRSGVIPMLTKSDAPKTIYPLDIDGLKEQADKTSVLAHGSVQKSTDAQPENFTFRPLTEREKTEFLNSLDGKGRKILAELTGKKSSPDPAAA